MSERASRVLFTLQALLLGLPTIFVVLPFIGPAALMLTPLALFGIGLSLAGGGPQMGADLLAGGALLLKGVLGICAAVGLVCFLGLAGCFIVQGRAGLRPRRAMLRLGILCGAPVFLLSSLPRLVEDLLIGPDWLGRLLPALLFSGLPLLPPALHLGIEAAKAVRGAPAGGPG